VNRKDYYSRLGLHRDATQNEIKRAYRRLALKYHPDRNPNDKEAEEMFKEVNEAYAVLADHEKRAMYDRFGPSQFRQRWEPEDIFRSFSFNDLFREFDLRFDQDISRRFFCGARRRGCGRRKARFFPHGLFHDSHAGFGRNDRAVYDILLNPTEALRGTQREIVLNRGWETERLTVKIPSGVKNDTILRLSLREEEERHPGEQFYLRVRVAGS
jgi:curved DNA-binding protein